MTSQEAQPLEQPPISSSSGPAIATSLVGLVLVCGMWGGAYFGFLRDRFKTEHVVSAHLLERQEVLHKLNDSVKNRAQFDAEMSDLQNQIALAEQKLPANDDISSFLDEVAEIASLSGLNLQSFEEGTKRPLGQLIQTPVKVLLSGEYEHLVRFLTRLAAHPRIVEVSGLHITTFFEDDDKTTLSIELNLIVYNSSYVVQK
jgi:Tfp pilus assembly protein PilO